MINYKIISMSQLHDIDVDKIYSDLLLNKLAFVIINVKGVLKVLTKEKSLFSISDKDKFIEQASKDIYYKTSLLGNIEEANKNDIKLYKQYIDKFSERLIKNIYGGKYIFGSVAVKTNNGFITTIRGKENLDEFTVVYNVDHNSHVVSVANKKATLNAPLLHYLFKRNKELKVIVHLNGEFDENLTMLDYAFPGTKKDSVRDINKSFNIRHHGVVYLFDKNGEML